MIIDGLLDEYECTRVGILGTGSYVPEDVVGNDDVARPAGVTAEWIERKTAITARRRARLGQATSDLGAAAARQALDEAGITARDVALVVVATSTPDSPQPPTAVRVAAAVGVAEGAPCFDVNAVCSGFVYALRVAERMIRGTGRHALVVGADVYSRILDPADRRTAILFGDGAGAVVLGPVARGGLLAAELASFPAERELIRVPGGGSRVPPSHESLENGLHYFTMDGRGVADFVSTVVTEAITRFMSESVPAVPEPPHFVPHQANGRMIKRLAAELGFPPERTHTTVEELGNTGAASVPITLDHAAGRFRDGDLVLLAGFGGGMAAGFALVEWSGSGHQSD